MQRRDPRELALRSLAAADRTQRALSALSDRWTGALPCARALTACVDRFCNAQPSDLTAWPWMYTYVIRTR